MTVTPFTIAVSDADLADLRDRLDRARFPDSETVDDWSQGVPAAYLEELCDYWRTAYDWRVVEAKLNALGQLRAEVDGLGIHFLHQRSPHDDALPLVLTHGWPGSVVEFLKVIGPLTDPTAHGGSADDAFHVVCPSLPGYGWSDKPTETGWGVPKIASAWTSLMVDELGYDRFGAQGGDWGSMVTSAIGTNHADHIAGIHLNMALALPSSMDDLTEAETSALGGMQHYQQWDSGYSKQQSTRPQTVGYGLADSPAGQCAWILEKLWAWTDCDGNPENALTRDEMLDDITLYWLTNTAASSARLYWESFESASLDPVAVPTGISVFPKEIFRTSERWARARFTDLRHFNTLDRGGHFAAWEQPETFVDEVRTFFRTVR
ncbi:MAG: epoxide hydrolase [Actinomycetota bacterium]|nr:epoxide hydrolase [Actinomycetota bacterium]